MNSQNFELLREMFPGRVNIGFKEALEVAGINVGTGFNNPQRYFPSFKLGGRRFVSLPVLAAWLDEVQGQGGSAGNTLQPRRGPGRPRRGD